MTCCKRYQINLGFIFIYMDKKLINFKQRSVTFHSNTQIQVVSHIWLRVIDCICQKKIISHSSAVITYYFQFNKQYYILELQL